MDPDPKDQDVREAVLRVAKDHAQKHGWPWLEPISVRVTKVEPRQWTVQTHVGMRGQNIRVVVREADLAIVEGGFLPR